MTNPYFIASEPGYIYSRPCFNGAGDTIMFMRKSKHSNSLPFGLFTVPAFAKPPAKQSQYYQPKAGTIAATRPDWCWDNEKVAFSSTASALWVIDGGPNSGARKVPIVPPTPSGPPVPSAEGHNYGACIIQYPSWYPGGEYVSATNYGPYQAIKMSTETGDFTTLTVRSPPTMHPDKQEIWVGMTSVSHGAGNPIAFAGQRPSEAYNQKINKIWIKEADKEDPYLLEGVNAQQGRAPWFSPHGDRIVFESNRQTNGNLQLYISDFPYRNFVQGPLTPDTWISQHAKWSPDGKWLTFHGLNTITKENGICLLEL